MKMRKLNNKGFTLVELLAVVVILAVVMGIAMTSVLSSMNNSRKGSLQNSAKSVSQAFQTKYSENLVTSTLNDVYSDALGASSGYNFTNSGFFALVNGLNDELNLSTSTYWLDAAQQPSTGSAWSLDTTNKTLTTDRSFVYFDGSKFTVCLIAKQTGSYFVSEAASDKTVSIDGYTVTFSKDGTESNANVMWACSLDGEYSWK